MFSTFRSFRPCAVYDLTAAQSVTYVSFQFSNNFGFTNSCTKLARQWSFPKQLKFRPFSVPLYRLYEEKKIHRTKTTAKKVSSLRNTKLTVTFGERPFGNDPCSFAFWVFFFCVFSKGKQILHECLKYDSLNGQWIYESSPNVVPITSQCWVLLSYVNNITLLPSKSLISLSRGARKTFFL